jgi:RimJ/RimL family protein N-acetyltransferase
MSLTASPLRADEWAKLRAIRLTALHSDPGNFFRSLAEELARPDAEWRALLEDDSRVVFGIFDGDHLLGLTAAYADDTDPTGRTCGFGMTWLTPEARGKGAARLIYACRIDWAKARGFARIAVSHRADNEPSRRAMLAAGFREIGRRDHVWPDGAAVEDVMYELLL